METGKKKKQLAISILDSDPFEIKETLQLLHSLGIKNIHLDIGDTSFIPNITFGLAFINKLLQHDFIFDLHFMVNDPISLLEKLKLPKNCTVTVHYEIPDFECTLSYLRLYKVCIGVAIKPSTEIKSKILVDKVLIMGVEPGFGGQMMDLGCARMITKVREMMDCEIGIDGGVNDKSIQRVIDADYFVVGSHFFKSKDKKKCISDLEDILNK